MSEPVKKNRTAMIEDIFDQFVTTVATDRQLKVDEVKTLVDQGLITATQAIEADLVDRIAYPDEFPEVDGCTSKYGSIVGHRLPRSPRAEKPQSMC